MPIVQSKYEDASSKSVKRDILAAHDQRTIVTVEDEERKVHILTHTREMVALAVLFSGNGSL